MDMDTENKTTYAGEDGSVGLEPIISSSNATADTIISSDNIQSQKNNGTIILSSPQPSSKWEANDYTNDYQLLKNSMARQSAKTNLQQIQRKYILDYGFARNKHPLLQDITQTIVKIGIWILFLSSSGNIISDSNGSFIGAMTAWNADSTHSPIHKLHILTANAIISATTLHHWIIGMGLPLLLLTLVKYNKLGPAGYILDEYLKPQKKLSDTPPFFFYKSSELAKKKTKEKDTGNFVLCLLENWSSAVIVSLSLGLYSTLASSLGKQRVVGCNNGINLCTRLLTRLGGAAALYQYPSLLFELRRNDQPRPMCRSTTYMQNAVKAFLGWLPLGVASDVALLLSTRKAGFNAIRMGSVTKAFISIVAPMCHLVALGMIVRISKCSATSLSESTTFPISDTHIMEENTSTLTMDSPRQVKWRYQLQWRTPVRIAKTLRSWSNYFFTGHDSLLYEMDYFKEQPIRFDDFSTEGTHYLMQKGGSRQSDDTDERDSEDLIPHADAIAESLSLIFRDREAAIQNATQARLAKHEESYDTKALDDILGVAVQQTFGIGVSFGFDHFDPPSDEKEVSIHQLRARMAKSAIRRKKELDNAMKKELDTLNRLKENVATDSNKAEAETEMKLVEQGIRERYASEIEKIKDALLTLIPTNADMPKGTERFGNPIMVAEYVDLNAPFENRGEVKATVGSAPDSLELIEDYVRRDYGDEAADAYRRDEIAARLKEKELLSSFRDQYGELEDDETS